jgi:DNA-binding NtrC family response regulator
MVQRRRIPNIVVIEESSAVFEYLQEFTGGDARLHSITRVEEVTEKLSSLPAPDLILLDWNCSEQGTPQSGSGVLISIRKAKPLVPVIVLSCAMSNDELMQATKIGAAGFLMMPFDRSDLLRMLEQHIGDTEEPLLCAKEIVLDENTSFVRASRRMRDLEAECRLVAGTDIPVLVLGESGTGKEIAAMFIHKMSSRSQRSFLKVNCAAMPLDLLESELFGYEPGAFTGAVKSKPGKFELCNGGTIFLDEIGEMPTALQAKLLQVLQDGSFSRLGSRLTVKVDVRVIAATNINIKDAMAKKTFREDLYYRLNGFSIHMPPLRERRDEIPIFANYFMCRNASKFDRDPLPFSTTLIHALSRYAWPGNLRELDNTIKRYLVLADEQAIMNDLQPDYDPRKLARSSEDETQRGGLKGLVRGLKGDAESVLISKTLEDTRWNRKAAALNLQISYKALLYKIKQYSLTQGDAL